MLLELGQLLQDFYELLYKDKVVQEMQEIRVLLELVDLVELEIQEILELEAAAEGAVALQTRAPIPLPLKIREVLEEVLREVATAAAVVLRGTGAVTLAVQEILEIWEVLADLIPVVQEIQEVQEMPAQQEHLPLH
jgi:hypothetical protein